LSEARRLKRKRAKRKAYLKVREFMFKFYPSLFDPDQPVPLKIGIHNDIREKHISDFGSDAIKIFCWKWFRRWEYHQSFSEATCRKDLDGNDLPLEDAHKERHASKYKEWLNKNRETA